MTNAKNEDAWRHFLKLCASVKSTDQLDSLLQLFLTLEEKENIATRYLIIQELLKGENSQREISQELQVSIAKITRGSNSLKIIDKQLRKLLEKYMQ